MITDADIKKLKGVFATKDDLKAMEVRQDKKYATKDDLKAMEVRQDKKFATKDDLKNGLAETTRAIVKEITDYLHENIILELEKHERRIDRLEKTVGGFPPLAD